MRATVTVRELNFHPRFYTGRVANLKGYVYGHDGYKAQPSPSGKENTGSNGTDKKLAKSNLMLDSDGNTVPRKAKEKDKKDNKDSKEQE